MTSTAELPVVDVSRVRVDPAPGRTKIVTVPVDDRPVPMGMHGPVAEHYQVSLDEIEPHATTLDYLVGAATGCLTGTFGGQLAALGQSSADGRLVAHGEGTVVNDGGTLRIASIHVRYDLVLDLGVDVAKVHRAHERHHRFCPIARSIGGCIEITSSLRIVER